MKDDLLKTPSFSISELDPMLFEHGHYCTQANSEEQEFSGIVLDEAQNIKNHGTQVGRNGSVASFAILGFLHVRWLSLWLLVLGELSS